MRTFLRRRVNEPIALEWISFRGLDSADEKLEISPRVLNRYPFRQEGKAGISIEIESISLPIQKRHGGVAKNNRKFTRNKDSKKWELGRSFFCSANYVSRYEGGQERSSFTKGAHSGDACTCLCQPQKYRSGRRRSLTVRKRRKRLPLSFNLGEATKTINERLWIWVGSLVATKRITLGGLEEIGGGYDWVA